MSGFATILGDRVEAYIVLRRSLGFSLKKQAAILRSLVRYVELKKLDGPLTRAVALDFFIVDWNGEAQLIASDSGQDPAGPTLGQLGAARSSPSRHIARSVLGHFRSGPRERNSAAW